MKEYKKLVNENKDLVYNQAYYYTGSREDAEDITQEVFIRLWDRMDEVKPGIRKFWILRVTKNLCIDYQRKKKVMAMKKLHQIMQI